MPNVAVSTFEKIKFGNRHSKVGKLAHFHKRVWLAFVKFKRQVGVKVQSQEICEGNRVLKEQKIFNDWTLAVHVNSRKVAKETVGIFELRAFYSTGCPKSSFLYVISLYFSSIGLGKQII